ncbi:DNA replication complex GINS family protein [Candidatus Bathyarchaeota archaeon]|nr:DNA replication complex GINS family protein [Candidatus Bathyarchaeota archaeon]
MQDSIVHKIKVLDFIFENSPVKVIANRNCPEIKLAGLTVGPFEEGSEYEILYWVAKELEKFGVVRLRNEDMLDSAKLYKIHWKERVQTAGQISELPRDFYPKLGRFLKGLKEQTSRHPEKMREYEKAKQLALDILNLRLKKIVSLASAPAQTEHVLRNLTAEERLLYEQIYRLINKWKTQLLEREDRGGGKEE